MRHRVTQKSRLGRKPDHTALMLRNLATSLIIHGRIQTTEARAARMQPYVERIIANVRAKMGNQREAIRYLKTELTTEEAQKKALAVVAPAYTARAGGFTRITPLAIRPGDGTMKVLIELV